MAERLQKLISSSGLCSRRAAEDLIRAGRVTVNGKKATIGQSANAFNDLICVDGKAIDPNTEKVYIMLNKPRGYLSAVKDDRGRKTVTQLVTDVGVRLYPAGRLDLNSEGLLIMTNDGDGAMKLMHPSRGAVKRYSVTVKGRDIEAAVERLCAITDLDGEKVSPARVEILSQGEKSRLGVSISQGLNRQVRRLCEEAGLEVLRLKRVGVGELKLGGLKTGQWRHLTKEEIRYITSKP